MRRSVLAAIVFAVGACGGGNVPEEDVVPTRGLTAVAAYRHHHPRVVSYANRYELTAIALAPRGMLMRTFQATNMQWTDWNALPLPADAVTPPDPDEYGAHLPIVALPVRGSPAFGGVFLYGAQNNSFRQALPHIRNPARSLAFSWSTADSPQLTAGGLNVRRFHGASILRRGGSYVVFGTPKEGRPDTRTVNPLFRMGANVTTTGAVGASFTNLGEPTVDVAGQALEGRVQIGPSAAVEVPVVRGSTTQQHTFVFVKARPQAAEERIAYWRAAGSGDGVWVDAGLPPGTRGQIYGAPIAVTRFDPATRRTIIHLFVTMTDDRGAYHLYERQWNDIGRGAVDGAWMDWVEHDRPRGLAAANGFALTAHATWSEQGGPTRITMMGVAEADRGPPHLIEYSFDGSSWNWGQAHAPPPDGQGVGTSSMAVLVFGAYRRVSVLCRAHDGAVWEYAYETGGRVARPGWTWTDLS